MTSIFLETQFYIFIIDSNPDLSFYKTLHLLEILETLLYWDSNCQEVRIANNWIGLAQFLAKRSQRVPIFLLMSPIFCFFYLSPKKWTVHILSPSTRGSKSVPNFRCVFIVSSSLFFWTYLRVFWWFSSVHCTMYTVH